MACSFDSGGATGSESDASSAESTAETSGVETSDGEDTSGPDTSPTTSETSDPTSLDASAESGGTTTASGPDTDSTDGGSTVDDTTGSASTDTSTGSGLACPDLLWVGAADDVAGTDGPLVDRALADGFSIVFVTDSDAVLEDAADACAVVISGTADGGDVSGKFRDVDRPVVTWEYNIYDDMGFAGGSFGVAEPLNDIDITDAAHPLAAGYAGTVAIFSGTGRVGWATGTGAQVIAVRADDAAAATLFEYQPGDLLADGGAAAGLRIVLPIMDAPDGTLETAALDLFSAAIHRATGS
jgi:hypothetical protein